MNTIFIFFIKFYKVELSKVVQKYQMVVVYDIWTYTFDFLWPNFKMQIYLLFCSSSEKKCLLHFLDSNLMSLEGCVTLPQYLLSSALLRKDHVSKFNQFSRVIILHSALKVTKMRVFLFLVNANEALTLWTNIKQTGPLDWKFPLNPL